MRRRCSAKRIVEETTLITAPSTTSASTLAAVTPPASSVPDDGKYRFDPSTTGGFAQTIELTQWLVAKEAAGK